MEQRPHHRSKRSSSALATSNLYSSNNNHHHHHHEDDFSISPPLQCSAYFISRQNLNDYAVNTLKQTVDRVISGPRSKGLKVKISLPDEGLVIDNLLDSDQSWMYKTSELLYFWQDFAYINIIVVITSNRPDYYASEPYSASIFRLRGHGSVQLFIQRAQQFFAQLSTSNITRNNSKTLIEKSAVTENMDTTDQSKIKHNRKSKSHSRTNKSPNIKSSNSSKSKKTDQSSTQTEFDPKKRPTTTTGSSFEPYKQRTYSETTLSSEARSLYSKKANNNNDGEDNKNTTVNSYLPGEYVQQLIRELKELRNEIAALKLDARFTPVHSSSTSPIPDLHEKLDRLSPKEMDAETQTDLSLLIEEKNDDKRMDVSNDVSVTNKRKKEPSDRKVNKRPVTNNTGLDREETTKVENSSQINGLSNGKSSSYTGTEFQPTLHPKQKIQDNDASLLNNSSFVPTVKSTEKTSFLPPKPTIVQKEVSNTASTKNTSSSSASTNTGEIVSFRASLEDTIDPPENIYENIPIGFQANSSNQEFYVNLPGLNKNDQQDKINKPSMYVTVANDRNSDLQKEYLSQLFGPQNGIALLLPKETIQNNINGYNATQEIKTNGQQYFQQALFSNHLTNPLFDIDKQLLANTIANQFGIDPKSPFLEKLIANQHLFVSQKRTFANMVWQITPEEESDLRSSPETTTTTPDVIDANTVGSNSPTAKSILKAKKASGSGSKGQHISWDNTLE